MKMFKKKNAKGFTLVELIVVMAIIGVLAAVLIPSMLGFMRDSRISKANQNAQTVYTAAQACLTKYTVANGTADTDGNAQFAAGNSSPSATPVAADLTFAVGSNSINMFDYLGGSKFRGTFRFGTNASGDSVEWALWSDQQDLKTVTTNPLTAAAQETAYDAGQLIGKQPTP